MPLPVLRAGWRWQLREQIEEGLVGARRAHESHIVNGADSPDIVIHRRLVANEHPVDQLLTIPCGLAQSLHDAVVPAAGIAGDDITPAAARSQKLPDATARLPDLLIQHTHTVGRVMPMGLDNYRRALRDLAIGGGRVHWIVNNVRLRIGRTPGEAPKTG